MEQPMQIDGLRPALPVVEHEKKRPREEGYAAVVRTMGTFDLIAMTSACATAYRSCSLLPDTAELYDLISGELIRSNITVNSDMLRQAIQELVDKRAMQHTILAMTTTFTDWGATVPASHWSQADVQKIAAYYCKFLKGLWIAADKARNAKDVQETLTMLVLHSVDEVPRGAIVEDLLRRMDRLHDAALTVFETALSECITTLSAVAMGIAAEAYTQDGKSAHTEMVRHISIYARRLATTPSAVVTSISRPLSLVPRAHGGIKALAAYAPPEGVIFCPREVLEEYSESDAIADLKTFESQRGVHFSLPEDAPIAKLAHAQEHCCLVINKVCSADSDLGRGSILLIHGSMPWSGAEDVETDLIQSKLVYTHICERLGWYNESPHAGQAPFNPVRPRLDQKISSAFKFSREGSHAVTLPLEVPVTFGCIGTAQHWRSDRCIVSEIQQMKLPIHLTRQEVKNEIKTTHYGNVTVQVLPFHRHQELRDPNITPLLGCITGIPIGFNATPLACACLSAIRQWIRCSTTVPSTEVLLLTDFKWTSLQNVRTQDSSKVVKPVPGDRDFRDRKGRYSARMELYVKLIYVGGDGSETASNSSPFVQLKSALELNACSDTLHVNGFRLRYHSTLQSARSTGPQYSWIQDKTPCTIFRNIRPNVTARQIIEVLLRTQQHLRISHEIEQIVILPALVYQNKPDEPMKHTLDAAVLIWSTRVHELDTGLLEELLQDKDNGGLKVAIGEDLPGRDKLAEAAAWFNTLPDKVVEARPPVDDHTPTYSTPTSRILGTDWVDSTVADTPSPGTALISRSCHTALVSLSRQTPETGLVRAPDPNTQLLLQLMGRIEQLEVEAKVTQEEQDRRRLADLAATDARRDSDLEKQRLRDASFTTQIQEVRDSARADISKMAEMGERNRKATSAMDRLMVAHQCFLDARAKHIVDQEWFDSIPTGSSSAAERRQVTAQLKSDVAAVDRGRQRLRQAREEYAHAACDTGVDVAATLAVYNE